MITTAWTFVATGNAIRHAGAHPVVLDVEPDHWQLDPAQLERFLTGHCTRTWHGLLNPDSRRIVTAVMPVYLLGHPADLDPIRALADAHGLALVCAAAQAVGATYRARPIGAQGLSAVSFNANKIITTGGGGAIVTDDAGLADRAHHLVNQAREHPVEYRHGEVGFNYRMTNLQVAIGCAQLERIEAFIAAKRAIFDRYAEALADLDGVRFQAEAAWAHATRWFTTCLIAPERSATTAPRLRAWLADADIAAWPPWTPLHLTGAHRHTAPWPSPVAETLGRNAIHLPRYQTRSSQDRFQTDGHDQGRCPRPRQHRSQIRSSPDQESKRSSRQRRINCQVQQLHRWHPCPHGRRQYQSHRHDSGRGKGSFD